MSHGEIAYNAYRDHTGGKSLATGQPIPEWEQLPAAIRDAWEAAAAALAGRRSRIFRMIMQLRAIADADDAYFRRTAGNPLNYFERRRRKASERQRLVELWDACIDARKNAIEGLFHNPFDWGEANQANQAAQ